MLQKLTGDTVLRVKHLVFFVPEEKTMEVTEAQKKHMITTTDTRLFLRSPTTSSETFTQEVGSTSLRLVPIVVTLPIGLI